MVSLTPHITEITDIIIDHIKHKYPNISLLVMYGSRARGTSDINSDLEFYVVVEDKKKEKCNIEFLFNKIPVDVWTQDWKSMEEVITGKVYWCLPAGTIANSKVVYARTEEERLRYVIFQEKIRSNDISSQIHLDAANKVFSNFLTHLGQLTHSQYIEDLAEARSACWNIIITFTYILARVNARYLEENWGMNLTEALEFDRVPEKAEELLKILAHSDDYAQLISAATELIEKTRQMMIELNTGNKEEVEVEMLGDIDALGYNNKIRKAAKLKNILGASYAVHDFQRLIAKDMLKLHDKWDVSDEFKTYNELKWNYDENGFPDFTDVISQMDFNGMNDLTDIMEEKLLQTSKLSKVPNFTSIAELRAYLD